jgi:hypothetical protein
MKLSIPFIVVVGLLVLAGFSTHAAYYDGVSQGRAEAYEAVRKSVNAIIRDEGAYSAWLVCMEEHGYVQK